MVDFKLVSDLKSAKLRLRRKNGKEEEINVERPFYRDMLEVEWRGKKYKIVRSGLIVREARIYREGEYYAKVLERLGVMTHFDIYRKAKKVLTIDEKESLFKHCYDISKGKKTVGVLRPSGLYIPILSNIGKGYEGEYTGITRDDEEVLILSLLAVCV